VGIVDDVVASAEWMARALKSSGYRADFTPQSLWDIDRFFGEQTEGDRARPDGLLAESPGQRLFGLGCYVGEVVRQSLGGEWEGDDADESAEVNVALRLDHGPVIWPVQRIMKRFLNGPEDGVAVYGRSSARSAYRPPPRPSLMTGPSSAQKVGRSSSVTSDLRRATTSPNV
jgi:hypothetical protein